MVYIIKDKLKDTVKLKECKKQRLRAGTRAKEGADRMTKGGMKVIKCVLKRRNLIIGQSGFRLWKKKMIEMVGEERYRQSAS